MLMTFEEQNRFWCPHVRCGGDELPYDNCQANHRNPFYARCIGCECSQWRWADDNKEEGYCGLAGVPREVANRR